MKTKSTLIFIFALLVNVASFAQKTKVAFGKPAMDASKNVTANLDASREYSNFNEAIKSAEFVDFLNQEGPFTILAPANTAFAKKSELIEKLNKPENIHYAKDVVAYHIIEGKWYVTDFGKLVRAGKGKGEIKTSNGEILVITLENRNFYFTDKNGNKAKLIISDDIVSNGILHGIDTVLQPN